MSIKAIVVDMDGTLLTDDHRIGQLTKETLIQAQKKGIKLILASGRNYRTLTTYGLQLLMDEYEGYFVGANGAAVTSVKTKVTEKLQELDQDELNELYTFALNQDVEFLAVQDDTIYSYIPNSMLAIKDKYRKENNIPEDVPNTAGTFQIVTDQRKGYPYIYNIDSNHEFNINVNKVCIAQLEDKVTKFEKIFCETYGNQFDYAKTSPQWFEIMPKGINKGTTIKKLLEYLNISPEETMIFGDGENDIAMLSITSNSIAMANAMENVKKHANHVTEFSNNEDGISKYLLKHKIV